MTGREAHRGHGRGRRISGIGTLARWLIEALGADYAQWRVLSRIMWKMDLRMTGYVRQGDQTRKRRVPWSLVLYGFFGVGIAFGASAIPGLLLSGTLALAIVGTLVCSVILLEFHAVVISPDDYAILGHQPVTSRTYFLVKVTNVLAHTGLMGALVGGPSLFPFLSGHGPAVAAAWLAALAGTVTATTVAIISVYAALLRWVPPDRLSRMLSYTQLLLMSVFAVGILFSDEVLAALLSVEIPERLLLLLPPAWFASLLTLASGEWSAGAVLAVLAAVASTGTFLLFASRRLSLAYAERLGALLAAGDARRSRKWMGRLAWRWLSPEFRVVTTLVRGQFRHDMQFRLAVLGLLPLTFVYVLMALQDGPLPDPFIERGFASAGLWLIHMAAVFMPLTLVDSFFRSDSFRAAWVFFVAPVDRARLVMKIGDSVAVFFLVPYVAFLSAILAWSFGDIRHGIAHSVVLGLFARLVVQMRVVAGPQLPFSQPQRKGRFSGAVFTATIIGAIAIMGVLPLILGVAYSATVPMVTTMVILAAGGVVMSKVGAKRIRARVEALEFFE